MNKLIFFMLLILFISCEIKPEPLNYGTDACYTCKMTLMDDKFGAEMVTKKGKIYKFDDVNCMIDFYHSGVEPHENVAFLLVVNYTKPTQLMDATNSWYLKSDSLRTPMASGIAAFATKEEYSPYKKKWKAILMGWGETSTQFK